MQNMHCFAAYMTMCVCCVVSQCWVPHVHAGSGPVRVYGPLQSPKPEGQYERAKKEQSPYQQEKYLNQRGLPVGGRAYPS